MSLTSRAIRSRAESAEPHGFAARRRRRQEPRLSPYSPYSPSWCLSRPGGGIYLLGAHHTPNYDNGLFGEHGAAAVDLKAQLSTALLGLTLIQPGLALWMYGRVPGAPLRCRRGRRASAPRRSQIQMERWVPTAVRWRVRPGSAGEIHSSSPAGREVGPAAADTVGVGAGATAGGVVVSGANGVCRCRGEFLGEGGDQ
ncbi:DUF6529 family protein [Streptomyces sp. NPDC048430]|uniref:DUF6529 family protein n=1 Tax=Streptomyces sp. NPDC048430 TaxID=3155388 RepID=UPI00342267BF